jgi:hypothetical protein
MPKRSAAEANNDGLDWNSYTVPELKDEPGLRGLSKTGKKADLIARLEGQGATQSDQPLGTAPTPGAAALVTRAPKPKKAKTHSPEPVFEGPLASYIITNQDTNRETGEKRLREFVPAPDDKFKDKLKRINRERMFMLDRTMAQDWDRYPIETFTIAGSTGNIYTCTIGRKPNCNCMDAVSHTLECTILC